MDKIKKGLGRGLSSLIGETKVEAQKNQERDIPGYITLDEKKLSSTFVRVPQFAEVPYAAEMQPNLVIEYYSR